MKEITRIHLAQTPFNAEIDARKVLEKYLEAIRQTLGADDDTMREIEARIVELLAERGVANERVITTADVAAVEARLGAPDDFADETIAENDSRNASKKRLMRDRERGWLGGVAAGIADYFGVSALWPRLVAILLTFVSFGTAVIVYFVLWLVIAPAKTAANKLQMRGEPVTLAALKSETREAFAVREGSKPLVIALRIVLGIGCVVLGLGAIGLIVAAVLVRQPLFNASMQHLLDSGTFALLGGAYLAMIVAGLLFVVLMVLAAYASFTWTINRKMLISGGVVIVLGLASFAAGVGLGIGGSEQANNQIAQRETSSTITAGQLDDSVTTATFTVPENLGVEYHVASGAPRIVVQYLRGQNPARVALTRDGNHIGITMSLSRNCNTLLVPCNGYDQVTIYGPALTGIAVQQGSISYYPVNQPRLTVAVAPSASVSLEGGAITSLNGTVGDQGSLDTEDSAVQTADVSLAVAASGTFGTVNTLAITTPKLCNANTASVTYQSVDQLTLNGVAQTRLSNSYPCLTINQ